MNGKIFITAIVIIAMLFSGCMADTGPLVISVDKTPSFPPQETSPTPEPAEEETPTPTPEPTPRQEAYDYIEDVELSEGADTMYFGFWEFGGSEQPFRIDGQDYNKGIGMFIRSKNFGGEKASISSLWVLRGNYHRISFDLGCEQTLQYGNEEKYGTFQIVIYADGVEIWDSGQHDYSFTAIGEEVDLPDGCRVLMVTLTQTKGIKGTLNVAMGSFKLYYYE